MFDKMCSAHKVSWVLMVVGGLNWGLVGVGGFMHANWNVVNLVLGRWPQVEWLVYVLVGLSTLMMLMKSCKMCMAEMKKR